MTGDRLLDGSACVDGVPYSVEERTTTELCVVGRLVGYPLDPLAWAAKCDADRRRRGLPAWEPPKRKETNDEARLAAERPDGQVVDGSGTGARGRGRDDDREEVFDLPLEVRPRADPRDARTAPRAGDDRPPEGRAGRGEGPRLDVGAATPPPGVRDTSVEAYRALASSGKMTAQQLLLVEFFCANRGKTFTRQELALPAAKGGTGLGINVVCGRANELLRAEPPILVERGRRRCLVTGNDVYEIELAGIA